MDRETLESQISSKVEETLNLLEEEWFQMSLGDAKRDQRRMSVFEGFECFCNKILSEERSIKETFLSRIKNNRNEILQICDELHITYKEPEVICLSELDKHLHNKLSELYKIKEERNNRLRILKEKEQIICNILGEDTGYVSIDGIPSVEDLNMFNKHIEELEQEKAERLETYKNLRREILGFIEKLEKPLEGELLFDVVCNNEEEVPLTKSYMLDVRKLHCDLEFETKEMESCFLELWEKISSLWSLLQISEEEKESFKATVPSTTPSSIKKMEFHLSELKEMRLQNLGKFIEDLKKELEKWWEKCFVSESQRNELSIDSEEITEEHLDKYEREVLRWKEYYSKNAHIFEKVEHCLLLFDNMQQLEEKAKDPSRLFNTRGGALLQEEKERKKVRQELPIVQEQLVDICLQYEEENGCPFLIDGNTVHEYLEKIWKYHDIQREKEKIERMQKKSKILNTPKSGTSSQKAVTPSKGSRKRVGEGDENERLTSAKKLQKTAFKSLKGDRPPVSGSSSVPKMRVLGERSCPPLTPSKPFRDEDLGLQTSISYDNFKELLRNKNENFNSTSLSCLAPENEDQTNSY